MFLRCMLAVIMIAFVSAGEADDSTFQWLSEYGKTEEKKEEDDDDNGPNFDPSVDVNGGIEFCSTNKGNRGQCVVYYLCNPDTLTFDPEKAPKSPVNCQSYLDVCCEEDDILLEDSLPVPDQAVVFPLKYT